MPFSSLSPLAQRLVGFATLVPIIALVWFDAKIASLIVWFAFILMGLEFSRLVDLAKPFTFIVVVLFAFVGMPLWLMVIDLRLILAVITAMMILLMWQKSFPLAVFVGLTTLCGVSAQVIINSQNGQYMLLAVCAVVAACDIAAFFVGRRVGGPKLAPSISPNKTVSGAIAGVVAAGILYFIFAGMYGLTPVIAFGFGCIIGCLAQLGDLFESSVKRQMGVKDSGRLIPGHGGLLDRFDGYLLTLPIVALVFFT
ncbi:phosphatidate cytidylyltransferase [Candidatus Puniceispirillum sp.]|uniref:phosphatidate cytidylyltransferase n=1 Tax=Candidatus Puniceispirillum sp. TaxID=2026719 RepID=UPI003F69B9BB